MAKKLTLNYTQSLSKILIFTLLWIAELMTLGLKNGEKYKNILSADMKFLATFQRQRGNNFCKKKHRGHHLLELIDTTNTVLFRMTTSVGTETDICTVYAPSDGTGQLTAHRGF